MKLNDLARAVGADPAEVADVEITGAAGIKEAVPGTITFLASAKYADALAKSRASAAFVPSDAPPVAKKETNRVGSPLVPFGLLYAEYK
mgnify:CR=1 FL=1